MAAFKPGDKVRLKAVSSQWIVPEETVMVILELVNSPSGESGAKCSWLDKGNGRSFEHVFPLSTLRPEN